MTESWRSVADALAARLNHATEHDHNPVLPDCPFCDDALAYERYLAKRRAVGNPVPDPFAGATTVLIEDLPLNKA